ncbi:MAG: hypothetical protein ACT4PM_14775 [Gemmatimonadales bacterium]
MKPTDVIERIRARLKGDRKQRVPAADLEAEVAGAEKARDELAAELLVLEQQRANALIWAPDAKVQEIEQQLV